MAVVTMKEMLDSGVHFGHQTRRWNPKMKRFIFTERNGIYIIDLQQTLSYVDRAYDFVKETVAHGGSVLFVGTKKQAQEAIAEQATRVGMPYVNQRWLGGMLTNFQTVYKRLQRLKELEAMEQAGWEGVTHQEGTAHPDPREGQAAAHPRRHPRDEPRAERGVDRRHQEGAHRRRRGAQAGHPGHRDPRHQLRPRRGRLQDPRQRRRDPQRRAADPSDRRRRRRGSGRPCRRAPPTPAATTLRRPRHRPVSSPPTSRCPNGSAICCSRRPEPAERGSRPLLNRLLTLPRPRPDIQPATTDRKRDRHGEYTAADVKRLRDATGAGMMDSKKALEEADGDFDKALEVLRIKGEAKAVKRGWSAARPTAWSPPPRAR